MKIYWEKIMRHINNNLSDFSSSDESDKNDEKQIKAKMLIFLEKAISKTLFENIFFESS